MANPIHVSSPQTLLTLRLVDSENEEAKSEDEECPPFLDLVCNSVIEVLDLPIY